MDSSQDRNSPSYNKSQSIEGQFYQNQNSPRSQNIEDIMNLPIVDLVDTTNYSPRQQFNYSPQQQFNYSPQQQHSPPQQQFTYSPKQQHSPPQQQYSPKQNSYSPNQFDLNPDLKYQPNYIPPIFEYAEPHVSEDDKNTDVEEVTYRIKELDINNLRPKNEDDDGVKYAMIGKPGTGKSSLIKAYMYSKRHIFPVGLFCNGTEDSTQFFSKHVPDLFIHPLSITLVESFIKRQKMAKQYLTNPWSLFITDDCMDDTKIFTKPPFKYLFKNGRHLKMSYIMSLQYSIDVKPDIRACIDGTFILRESNERFRKNLYENYASIIPSYNEFKAILDGITGDYTSLFIDNRATSNNVEDCVYYFKANLDAIDPNFKFGCQEFWDFSKQRYNPQYVVPF